MFDHAEFDGSAFDHYFEWGPAKHRLHIWPLHQQLQQQQHQTLDQRDESEERPDDN